MRPLFDILVRKGRSLVGSAPRHPVTRPQRSILVVDDDEVIRETLVAVLGAHGWNVLAAEHGAAAVTILERQPVELVLADVMMPVMDGHDLAARIRRDWPNTLIVLMSGDMHELERDDEQHHDDLIHKPFSCSDLLLKLDGLFAARTATGADPWVRTA